MSWTGWSAILELQNVIFLQRLLHVLDEQNTAASANETNAEGNLVIYKRSINK